MAGFAFFRFFIFLYNYTIQIFCLKGVNKKYIWSGPKNCSHCMFLIICVICVRILIKRNRIKGTQWRFKVHWFNLDKRKHITLMQYQKMLVQSSILSWQSYEISHSEPRAPSEVSMVFLNCKLMISAKF